MDIKKIKEQLEKLLEEQFEWRTETICKVLPLLNELFQDDVDMYGQLKLDEAVDTMKRLYDENKLRVCIPTDTSFSYKGNNLHLHLVMGNCEYANNKLICKYGIKHVLDKHSKQSIERVDDNSLCSEEKLLKAIKNINNALEHGKAFMSTEFSDRLIIQYQGFLYIICYARNEKEITYLHTLFKPTNKYLKRNFPSNKYPDTDINN